MVSSSFISTSTMLVRMRAETFQIDIVLIDAEGLVQKQFLN